MESNSVDEFPGIWDTFEMSSTNSSSPKKRVRPRTNSFASKATLSRRFNEDKDIITSTLQSLNLAGTIKGYRIVIQYDNTEKEINTFDTTMVENKLNQKLKNQCFSLLDWKLSYNISNEALKSMLGKNCLDHKIKGGQVLNFKKLCKNFIKEKIPIYNYTSSKENLHVVELRSMLPYLFQYRYPLLGDKVIILISADYRSSTKRNGATLYTFKILSNSVSFHSPNHIYTLALSDSNENLESLAYTMDKLIPMINSIQQNGIQYESTNGTVSKKIEFQFCSDLKFLSLILGVKAANSNFPCPFCTVHKTDKHLFNLVHIERTTSNMISKCNYCNSPNKKCDKTHGVKGSNLLSNIEMAQIFVDILHVQLRLTDVIEANLIRFATDNHCVDELCSEVLSQCKIKWNYQVINKEYKFSSLNCAEKRLILQKLKCLDKILQTQRLKGNV